MQKNALELVEIQKSLGFFNRLFLVLKPNNWWRPILDLSNLNQFLKVMKFKMETLEKIRTSIQACNVYLFQGLLPNTNSGLNQEVPTFSRPGAVLPTQSTTIWPTLMALHKGITIHQYPHNWLVRARSHHTYLRYA